MPEEENAPGGLPEVQRETASQSEPDASRGFGQWESKQDAREIAARYHLDEVDTEYLFSESLPKFNQNFLAMMDYYVSKVGHHFPDQPIQALDFGSGKMPYMKAYKAFLMRYGLPEGESRTTESNIIEDDWETYTSEEDGQGVLRSRIKEGRTGYTDAPPESLGIAAWEGDPDAARFGFGHGRGVVWVHGGRGRSADLSSEDQLQNLDQALRVRSRIDFLSMFGCGPGSQIEDPQYTAHKYRNAIALLSKAVEDGGLVVLTTSFGGPSRDVLTSALSDNYFAILLHEPNRFGAELAQEGGFSHDEVIIARKKVLSDDEKSQIAQRHREAEVARQQKEKENEPKPQFAVRYGDQEAYEAALQKLSDIHPRIGKSWQEKWNKPPPSTGHGDDSWELRIFISRRSRGLDYVLEWWDSHNERSGGSMGAFARFDY